MRGGVDRGTPAAAGRAADAGRAAPPAALIAEIAARARDRSIGDDDALAELWEAQPEAGDGKAA